MASNYQPIELLKSWLLKKENYLNKKGAHYQMQQQRNN